jgi:hypothetical protein
MRNIPNWVAGTIVLVLTCSVGVWIVNSFNKFPEGFSAESNLAKAAREKCEKNFVECKRTFSNKTCTTENDLCIAAANSKDPGQVNQPTKNAPSSGTSLSSATGALKIGLANSRNAESTAAILDTLATKANPGSNVSTISPGTLSSIATSKGSNISISPTDFATLLAAMRSTQPPPAVNPIFEDDYDEDYDEEYFGNYKPNQEYMKPHEMPKPYLPSLTASTQVENFVVPSLRQNIRSDGSKVGGFKNEYEITYAHA